MKSKAPLVMMEQMIMVLVFAIASALCLQTFVLSEKISEKNELLNRAALKAQNTAELLKASGPEQFLLLQDARQTREGWQIFLDAAWKETEDAEQAVYYMELCPQEETPDNFWKIYIRITTKDGTEMFCIPAAGQAEVIQK